MKSKTKKENQNANKQYVFVIMPFDKPDTEFIWEKVYEPTISKLGYKAIRTDKSCSGGLLISQIYNDINNSKFVIADLTYEKPNCYLEVGYSIGIGKGNDPLILCCRKDHAPNQTKKRNSRKIHFDLQGYRILWWDKKTLRDFKKELRKQIRYRESQMVNPKKID
jgi:hypothetical protein